MKVLYDAGRYIEFKDAKEASANVAYTGEIQGISAGCQYKDDEPIQVQMEVLFELDAENSATVVDPGQPDPCKASFQGETR